MIEFAKRLVGSGLKEIAALLPTFQTNGLYGQVQANNARSLLLFAGFALALQLVGAAGMAGPLLIFDRSSFPITSPLSYLANYGLPIFLLGTGIFVWQLRRHVTRTRQTTGFRDVTRREEPRLFAVVDEVAILAGIPAPHVAIIESDALNAFACGLRRGDARIVLTRALVDALDDNELAAVVAHEFAHIMHGDILRLACVNAMVATLEDGLALIEPKPRRKRTGFRKWLMVALFLCLPFLLVFWGALKLLRLATGWLRRQARRLTAKTRWLIGASREFIADAEAVRMTRHPSALLSALQKVQGRSRLGGLGPQAEAMMIDGLSPEVAMTGEVATHPSIEERGAAIRRMAGMALTDAPRRDTRGVRGGAAPVPQPWGAPRVGAGREADRRMDWGSDCPGWLKRTGVLLAVIVISFLTSFLFG